jgi:hypothetical protein
MSDSRPKSSNKRQKIDDLGKNAIVDSNPQPNIAYEDSGIKLTTVESLPDPENIDISLSSILSFVRKNFFFFIAFSINHNLAYSNQI